ncbi:MAG: hypothetical protein RL398_1029 [Planctomycetota bacterium]|jgi:ABC-type Zn uptake system ZnuABC Zn-binding protein ZnuA
MIDPVSATPSSRCAWRRLLPFWLVCAAVGAQAAPAAPSQPAATPPPAAAPHRIVATTADLAALCRAVGGERVRVVAFAKNAEDSHFVMARPSMTRELADAELLVEVGRELEIGWLPVLVQQCRNAAVQQGRPGRFVAADHVRALGVPEGPVDRSHGDVHAGGNPHFLLDPRCGLEVAQALARHFTTLWPADAAQFAAGLAQLRRDLAVAMVGPKLAERYDHDADALARLFAAGRLGAVLDEHGDRPELAGWFGALLPRRGSKVVADHDLWPYFAETFGLQVLGFLEPKPGIAPTTRHLQGLAEQMRTAKVPAILTVPYFPARTAEALARATGAKVVAMEHQPGARRADRAQDVGYVEFVDWNVRALAEALPVPAAGH